MSRNLDIFLLVIFLLFSSVLFAAELSSFSGRTGNVLVLANANDTASIEIAKSYLRARNLPSANLLKLDLNKSRETISVNEYNSIIQKAVDERLSQLGNHVDFMVIVRGVPYRVGNKSLTAALTFGGLKKIPSQQPFFGQQRSFEGSMPNHGTFMKLTTALITYTVTDAYG